MLNGKQLLQSDDTPAYRKQVHETLMGYARHRALLDCDEADALFEMKRLRLWRDYGCCNALEYMERVLGYTPHTALERLRVADELQGLPRMKAALRAGDVCFSAVREVTRVAVPATEQEWLDKIAGKNMRQIEDLVAHHVKGDRPTDDPDPTPKVCRVRFDEVKPETAALLREVRKLLDKELGTGRMDDDMFLQTLARRSVEPAAVENTVTPPANLVAIYTCKLCKRVSQNGAGVDLLVDEEVLEQAECDARFLGDLDAPDPERMTQSVTPRKRAQVFARDGYRCCVPGCRASRGLDIHHIHEQSLGGSHDMCNLILLCSGHHTLNHHGKLIISGTAPDALTFEWSRGEWWKQNVVPFLKKTDPDGDGVAMSHVGLEADVARGTKRAASHVGREAEKDIGPGSDEWNRLAKLIDESLSSMPWFKTTKH